MEIFALTVCGWTFSVLGLLVLMFIVGPILLMIMLFCCPRLAGSILGVCLALSIFIVKFFASLFLLFALPFVTLRAIPQIRKMGDPQGWDFAPDFTSEAEMDNNFSLLKNFCEEKGFVFLGFGKDRYETRYAFWANPELSMGSLYTLFPNGQNQISFETSFENKVTLSTLLGTGSQIFPLPDGFYSQAFSNVFHILTKSVFTDALEKAESPELLEGPDEEENMEQEKLPIDPEIVDEENNELEDEEEIEEDEEDSASVIELLWNFHQKEHQYLVEKGGAVFVPWQTWQWEAGWIDDGSGLNAKECLQKAYQEKEYSKILKCLFRATDLFINRLQHKICSIPFWYLRCGYWFIFRDDQYANKTIEEQYEAGLIKKLPKDL